ncbi:HAMP domain-containing histidine kinase [Reichenbachiella agarivorans]|uniref:histidine kinase n=1 Tax=Reichenbachiella agarivorans TaxID=2979464 RepID=A0ABY6CLE2_9BACT|nr:HAMP domain-containing sensor histidine kinase [Reichenbachiella agarivorans]UXP31336.1 HAMP domain-containing histidine kinase [Reichenbachiella agarivorans]
MDSVKHNDLLQKQIKKYTKGYPIPTELMPLLDNISETYDNFERDQELIERVMNVSSEELLDANQELKKINEEMDRFVYSTSHDLRAPLLSILGLLNIIEKENKQYDIQGYLKLLRDSTVNLDKFISDIIDYSRNSRLDVEKKEVDIAEIINESFKHLNYLPGCSTLLKLVNIDAKEKFYCDQRRLTIIFNNLISNAIKYQNTNISDSFVNIEAVIDEKQMKVEIEDNGIGIEQTYLQKIFDMFYRASPDSKGSGLGLYIVKEAIQKLEGQISVDSTFGMGTKFTIIIPNLERH